MPYAITLAALLSCRFMRCQEPLSCDVAQAAYADAVIAAVMLRLLRATPHYAIVVTPAIILLALLRYDAATAAPRHALMRFLLRRRATLLLSLPP